MPVKKRPPLKQRLEQHAVEAALSVPQPDPPPTLPLKKDWAWEDGELGKCAVDCEYFVSQYCIIDDKSLGKQFKFDLWPAQKPVLQLFIYKRKVVVLKARQIGLTWLALCKALWTALFEKPGCTILLFSLRDTEAKELLVRVKGVYDRLPKWMKCKSKLRDDAHELKLSNGSEFKAFPSGTGDSYTASMAVLDEFDLLEPEMQKQMLESIEPTVRAAGQLILISKANKRVKWSDSPFKKIYTDAMSGDPTWSATFLPWYARPDFKQDDYDAAKAKCFRDNGSYDAHYGNYPESAEQALAPSSGDKRFPYDWLTMCYRPLYPANPSEVREMVPQLTHIRGLRVFKDPIYGRKYVGGGDPAEGTPNSNPSGLVLLDAATGEEVVSLNEKLSPKATGKAMEDISRVYNKAAWLVERNNHGHALILWLEGNTEVRLLEGPDGRVGWPENQKTKTILFDGAVEKVKDTRAIIHSADLFKQLAMVESDTLDSPTSEGNSHGDLATAFVLAQKGIDLDKYGEFTDKDFQWGDAARSSGGSNPFGVKEPRQSGFGGLGGGGGGHNPFGAH